MNIIQKAADAIENGASADTLAGIKGELSARRIEAGQRLALIGERTPGYPGDERRKVIATGDFDALEKLDNEVRRIQSELQAIQYHEQRLHSALVAQRAREAVDNMPGQYKTLNALIDAERKALALLHEAQASSDARLRQIQAARRAVNVANNTGSAKFTAPAGDASMLESLLELRGMVCHPHDGFGRDGHKVRQMAETLGLEMTRSETMPNAAGWL